MSVCVPQVHLEQFLAGELSDEMEVQTADHCSNCTICSDRLLKLDSEFEALANRIGTAVAEFEDPALSSRILRKLDRIKNLTSLCRPQTGGASDFSVAAVPGNSADRSLVAGESIGPYWLLEEVASGGMGTVWKAEQQSPIKRTVAIKVTKSALATREVLGRFDNERQTLAWMTHPGVAQILDAGATPSGAPFFVMEFVDGAPLTRWCDEHRLPVRERLELFVAVCEAVQHAHQKGVIHRDLKPSNILVTELDGRPFPKVVDFGLAKMVAATGQGQDIGHGLTSEGQILGTLQYMSPEQAGLDNCDIDIRSDVYALGVVLYELLTGSTPLEIQQPSAHSLLDRLRHIREVDAVRPSLRFQRLGQAEKRILMEKRQAVANQFHLQLLRDLDWIVLRAVDRDRNRRYPSVAALASEIGRFLRQEPVEARPPSINYRLQKFVRKNRLAVLSAVIAIAALLAGMIGTSLALVRALNAESLASGRLIEANEAKDEQIRLRKLADLARAEAEKNLDYARKGNQILGAVFKGLDPHRAAGFETAADLRNAIVENLDRAETLLESAGIGDPLDVAEMQATLGDSFLGLGQYDKAARLLEASLASRSRLLGPDNQITILAGEELGHCYLLAGRVKDAVSQLEAVYEQSLASLGPDHPDTAKCMHALGRACLADKNRTRAVELLEKSVESAKLGLGHEHPTTISFMAGLALGYRDTMQLTKAVSTFEQVLELARKPSGTIKPASELVYVSDLAGCYMAAEQYDRAIPLYSEMLKLSESYLGPDHHSTHVTLNNLGRAYTCAGDLNQGLPLLERAHRLMTEQLGMAHPDSLMCTANLAFGYQRAGKNDLAIPLFELALDETSKSFGPTHFQTLLRMDQLASAWNEAGDIQKAVSIYEDTLMQLKSSLGGLHPHTLMVTNNLAAAYWRSKQFDKSVPAFEELLQARESVLGRDHIDTQRTVANLGVNYKDAGQTDRAIVMLKEAWETGKTNPEMAWVRELLKEAYIDGKQLDAFRKLVHAELEIDRREMAGNPSQLAQKLRDAGTQFMLLGGNHEAVELLQESWDLHRHQSPHEWVTLDTQARLGSALVELASTTVAPDARAALIARAENILLECVRLLDEHSAGLPAGADATRKKVIDHLARLYDLSDRSAEAAKWKQLQNHKPR